MNEKKSIGVFDSGLGGLWILKYLKAELPEYDYVFLGDQLNVSYGNKTPDELFLLATKALDFLYGEKNCAGVILACNTISSTIYNRLRDWKDEKYFGRILFGIVRPTVESIGNNDTVAIFATPRTCESEVYEKFFKENIKNYIKIPLPELAYLIENGGDTESYISSFKDKVPNDITRGALLCTHYGIVREDFKKSFPNIKDWVYQEEIIPKYIRDYFTEFPDREAFFSHNGTISILVTKENDVFKKFKDEWFGESVKIELVDLNK
jgi:glutamate racemase